MRTRPGGSPRRVRRSLLSALAIVLGLVWVFPVYWMVNSAFLDKVTLQQTTPTFLPLAAPSTTSRRSSATRDSFAR